MQDFNVTEGEAIITSDIDNLLQSINILFETSYDELVGNITFGTDYGQYLYDLRADGDSITQQVLKDLYTLDLKGFTPEVQTYILQGTEQDIILIEINLIDTNKQEKYTKVYTIK